MYSQRAAMRRADAGAVSAVVILRVQVSTTTRYPNAPRGGLCSCLRAAEPRPLPCRRGVEERNRSPA
eukprot:4538675-Prymnesium_polylepis.1